VDWEEDFRVNLQLWDIAGQDRFAALTRPYYRNAAAAVIVCDVTRQATLEAAVAWKEDLDQKLGDDDVPFPVVLLANKCDLLESGAEAMQIGGQIQKISDNMNMQGWFITSAKEDNNITEAMMAILGKLLEREKDGRAGKKEEIGGIKLSAEELTKKKSDGCC